MKVKKIIACLEEARKNAEMKEFHCSSNETKNEAIKEAVKLYNETWIIGLIDDALNLIRGD